MSNNADNKKDMKKVVERQQEESGDGKEECRCWCPSCHAEGWCLVTKQRYKELKEAELMEECCSFGDKCTGSGEQSSDEEKDEE